MTTKDLLEQKDIELGSDIAQLGDAIQQLPDSAVRVLNRLLKEDAKLKIENAALKNTMRSVSSELRNWSSQIGGQFFTETSKEVRDAVDSNYHSYADRLYNATLTS